MEEKFMKKALIGVVALVAAVALVLSIGCSKKSSSSDPGEFIMNYMKDVLKIVKDNSGNCDKAIKDLTSYAEKNKPAMEEAKKAAEEMEKKMSDAEKKEYGEKMMKSMEGVMKDSMSAVMEFSTKCPEQAAKLGEVMGSFK
jgi:hypothetical protein